MSINLRCRRIAPSRSHSSSFKLAPCVRSPLGLALGLVLGLTCGSARAESGRVNLHVDLAGMPHPPFGGMLNLGFDWQIRPPFALDFSIGGGYQGDTQGVFSTAVGVRFRFLDNREGYLNEPRGDRAGNLYLVPRFGLLLARTAFGNLPGVDLTPALTFDATLGYEWSVARPLQLGVFIRPGVGYGGSPFGYVLAGLGFSFEIGKAPVLDTDHDDLPDERELVRWHTSPYRKDSDGDRLQDGREVQLGTDPAQRDTDHGGSGDGWEVERGRNPLSAEDDDLDHDQVADEIDQCPDTPPNTEVDARGCTVLHKEMVLKGITFQLDSAAILPGSEATLQGAVRILLDNPTARVEIGGHTDDTGSADHNLRLSQERAAAVASWLIAHGVPEAQLSTRGYGNSQPKAANDTEAHRSLNRRIEFKRLDR